MKYSLGTVQFGTNYGIEGNCKPRYESAEEMLSFAIDKGINCFDTASAYGDSEDVLGRFLNGRNDLNLLKIVSKLHPYAFDDQPKEQWPDIALENAKDSLTRLHIQSFEAYLFHKSQSIFDIDAVNALIEVKNSGLAKRIGVSIYTPEEAIKALDYKEVGAIQVPYNVFDQRLDRFHFFERAKDQNVIIFARSSLLQGLATMAPEHLPERVCFAKNYVVNYRKICTKYSIGVVEAAIGYVSSNPNIDYIVFGVDNIEQMQDYISFRGRKLPDDMIRDLKEAFAEVDEKLVNPSLWR